MKENEKLPRVFNRSQLTHREKNLKLTEGEHAWAKTGGQSQAHLAQTYNDRQGGQS